MLDPLNGKEPGSQGLVTLVGTDHASDITIVNNYGESTNTTMIVHEITTRNLRDRMDLTTDVDLILTAPRIVLNGNIVYNGGSSSGSTQASASPMTTLGSTIVRLATGSQDASQVSGIEFGYGPINPYTGNQPYGSLYFNAGTGQFQFKSNKDVIGKFAPVKAKEFVLQATNRQNELLPSEDFTLRSRNGHLEFVHSTDGVFMVFDPPGNGSGSGVDAGATGISNGGGGSGGSGSGDTTISGTVSNGVLIMMKPTQFNQTVSMGSTSVFNGPVSMNGGPVEILGEPFLVKSATEFTGTVKFTGTLDARDAIVLLPPSSTSDGCLTATTEFFLGVSGAPLLTTYTGKRLLVEGASHPDPVLGNDQSIAGGGLVLNGRSSHYLVYSPTQDAFKLSDSLVLPNDGALYLNDQLLLNRRRLKLGTSDSPGEILLGGGERGSWKMTVNDEGHLTFDYRTANGDWVPQTTLSVNEADRVVLTETDDYTPSVGQPMAGLLVMTASKTWKPTSASVVAAGSSAASVGPDLGALQSTLQASNDSVSMFGMQLTGAATVNGVFPGPVAVLEPGDSWTMRFVNDLDQSGAAEAYQMQTAVSFPLSLVTENTVALGSTGAKPDLLRLESTLPRNTANWYGHGVVTTSFSGLGNSVTRYVPAGSVAKLQWTLVPDHYGGLYWCHPALYHVSTNAMVRGLSTMLMVNGPYQLRLIDANVQRQLWQLHVARIKVSPVTGGSVTWADGPLPSFLHQEQIDRFTTADRGTPELRRGLYLLSMMPAEPDHRLRLQVRVVDPATGASVLRTDTQYNASTRSVQFVNDVPAGSLVECAYIAKPNSGGVSSTAAPNDTASPLARADQGMKDLLNVSVVGGVKGASARRLRFQDSTDVPQWSPTEAWSRGQQTTAYSIPTINGQVLPVTHVCPDELQLISMVNTTPGTVKTVFVEGHVFVPVGVDGVPLNHMGVVQAVAVGTSTMIDSAGVASIVLAFGQRCEAFLYPLNSPKAGQSYRVFALVRGTDLSSPTLPVWIGSVQYSGEPVCTDDANHLQNALNLLPSVAKDPAAALAVDHLARTARYLRDSDFANWQAACNDSVPLYSLGFLDSTLTLVSELDVHELPIQVGDQVFLDGDQRLSRGQVGPAVRLVSALPIRLPNVGKAWVFTFEPTASSAADYVAFQTETNYLYSARVQPFTRIVSTHPVDGVQATDTAHQFTLIVSRPHEAVAGDRVQISNVSTGVSVLATVQGVDNCVQFTVHHASLDDAFFVVGAELADLQVSIVQLSVDVATLSRFNRTRAPVYQRAMYKRMAQLTTRPAPTVLSRHTLRRSALRSGDIASRLAVWAGAATLWTVINDRDTDWIVHLPGGPGHALYTATTAAGGALDLSNDQVVVAPINAVVYRDTFLVPARTIMGICHVVRDGCAGLSAVQCHSLESVNEPGPVMQLLDMLSSAAVPSYNTTGIDSGQF